MVPDYSKGTTIYANGGHFEVNANIWKFRDSEGGAGELVLNRAHQWLQYWANDPNTGNWTCYGDWNGAAHYTITDNGYLFFSYYQVSFYTPSEHPWQNYPDGKTLSFGCWIFRDGNLAVKAYARSGNYGEKTDEVFVPVSKGDVIYYGVLNKGEAMPQGVAIRFYPALAKK